MDETTISDIKQRAARWKKEYYARNGSESEHTWIFAVSIDDVELLLKMIAEQEQQLADTAALLRKRQGLITHLTNENDDLRLQLQAAREQLNSTPQWMVGVDPACPECDHSIIEVNDGNRVVARIKLGSDALEPDAPDGEMKYWFNIATGPYRALDIQAERDFSWSRGPFGSYREADQEWKAYIKRQNANGQP